MVARFLLFVAMLACVFGPVAGFLRPIVSRTGSRSNTAVSLKKEVAGAAIAAILLFGGHTSPAFADLSDEESDISMPVKVIGVSAEGSTGGNVKTVGTSSKEDESYGALLKKEQAKQESRKKDKVSRSKDLCETLGRGC
jgi:hypothetical protein